MSQTTEDTFDVVVVGAGLAGHTAALVAAENGATVLLAEKGEEFGGSSVLAGGGLVFAGSDLQRAAGIVDSPEALRADLVATGGGVADEALIDAFVDHQLETFEWLRSAGVAMSLADQRNPGDVVRVHFTGQGLATEHLHGLAVAHELVTYRSGMAVSRLGQDAADRVVAVETADGEVITATRGVVITTGGFSRSQELVQRFAPHCAAAAALSGRHNTGDGIRMAWAVGAGVVDMPYVTASFGAAIPRYPDLTLDPDEQSRLLFPNHYGAIIVNLEGRRFASEDTHYKRLSEICDRQPGAAAIQVFDRNIFDQSDSRAVPFDFKAAYESGLVRRGETLADLAVELCLDPEVLIATVERYNASVRAGSDPDFGRSMRFSASPGGGLIETSPFYGAPTRSGLTSTYAGLTVQPSMQVRNVFGEPIEGLYAAGEVVGGFHGAAYYSGTGLGKAAVLGLIAGRSAATAEPAS